MKTLLFWHVENIESSYWTEDNLIQSFLLCILKLLNWIKQNNIPHYFVKDSNLIDGKFTRDMRQRLIEILDGILKDIWTSLSMCDTFLFIRKTVLDECDINRLKEFEKWQILAYLVQIDSAHNYRYMKPRVVCNNKYISDSQQEVLMTAKTIRSTRKTFAESSKVASFLNAPEVKLRDAHIATVEHSILMKEQKKGTKR